MNTLKHLKDALEDLYFQAGVPISLTLSTEGETPTLSLPRQDPALYYLPETEFIITDGTLFMYCEGEEVYALVEPQSPDGAVVAAGLISEVWDRCEP